MKKVTRHQIAQKIADYLNHSLSLDQLVDWAEEAMQEGEFEEKNFEDIRDIIGHLGLADVKSFGLTWQDCEDFLRRLGYQARIELTAVQ